MTFIKDYEEFKSKKYKEKQKEDLSDDEKRVIKDFKQSERYFQEVLHRSGVAGKTYKEQFNHLEKILLENDELHNEILRSANAWSDKYGGEPNFYKPDVKVTGTVTEKIVELGLNAAEEISGFENRWHNLPQGWNWVGDFLVVGMPFNLHISVKSYTARERLMASGTGQFAAPVIGFGLFNKKNEWSYNRVIQYKHRGFVAIFMPSELYDELANIECDNPTHVVNIHGKPLIRRIESFANDVAKIISEDMIIDLRNF